MTLRVERCNSGPRGYFRVSDGKGGWCHVANPTEDRWSRSHATEALDYFTHHHGHRRRNLRFYVV